MKKIKDALILFGITVVAGLLLGLVNEVTKDAIAEQETLKMAKTYQAVYAEAASFEESDALAANVAQAASILEQSSVDMGNVEIADAVEALDASGSPLGYVVQAVSKDGYGGNIKVAVGISGDGTVLGIDFLEINETAGLGMNATKDEFKDQFKDKTVEAFAVTKLGASSDEEIDALSGATFTTNAVTNAVNAALCFTAAMGQ